MQVLVCFSKSRRSLPSPELAEQRLAWLRKLGVSRDVAPLFTRPVEELLEERARLERVRRSRSLPDLTRWFRVGLPESLALDAFQKILDSAPPLPGTQGALASPALSIEQTRLQRRFKPRPAPPPGPIQPLSGTSGDSGVGPLGLSPGDDPTPNLAIAQGYLLSAPSGLGFAELPGWPASQPCKGLTVAVIDEDYLHTHEDLRLVCDPSKESGVVGQYAVIDHGTASMGLLFASLNLQGFVGLASGASPLFVHPWVAGSEHAPSVENAISRATGLLLAGDVILLEQAAEGLPSETETPVFEALEIATAKGIHVVEPTGNNMDDLALVASAMQTQDSGAIVVASGLPPVRRGDLTWPRNWTESNHGARVDAFAWGQWVTTLFCDQDDPWWDPLWKGRVAGQPDRRRNYTNDFSASSSASALVAGVVATASAVARRLLPDPVPTPVQLRNMLVSTGTPQDILDPRRIGVQPDLVRLLRAVRRWTFRHSGILEGRLPTLMATAIAAGTVKASCPTLDGRQHRVLRLMSLGLTNAEILALLGPGSVSFDAEILALEGAFVQAMPDGLDATRRRLYLLMVATHWKLI
jgi:hypothetical protein